MCWSGWRRVREGGRKICWGNTNQKHRKETIRPFMLPNLRALAWSYKKRIEEWSMWLLSWEKCFWFGWEVFICERLPCVEQFFLCGLSETLLSFCGMVPLQLVTSCLDRWIVLNGIGEDVGDFAVDDTSAQKVYG